MFLIEQIVAPALSSTSHHAQKYALAPTGNGIAESPISPTTPGAPDLDLDIELEMELNAMGVDTRTKEVHRNPRMLTLGLVIHSLADGMALGAANALSLTPSDTKDESNAIESNAAGLSFIVFVAIAIHKGEDDEDCCH